MQPDKDQSGFTPAERSRKWQEASEFYASILDLLNDEITGPVWLGKFAELANANAVACAWWPAGRPAHYLEESAGTPLSLPDDWVYRLDAFFAASPPPLLEFLDESQAGGRDFVDNPDCAVLQAGRLIVCLERDPACIVMIVERSAGQVAWTQRERERLREFLQIVRKSIVTKRRLSALQDQIDLANGVFDAIPRCILTMTPDRSVIVLNKRARAMAEVGSIFRVESQKFTFTDSAIQRALEEQLAIVMQLKTSELNSYSWFKNVPGAPGAGSDELLTMRALGFRNWRIESSEYERAVVLTLVNKEPNLLPGETRLREFYDLTRAQARLVNEMMRHGSLDAAADAVNISIHTARSHLRAIYEKLNVSNQAQFFRLISQSFTAYAPEEDE